MIPLNPDVPCFSQGFSYNSLLQYLLETFLLFIARNRYFVWPSNFIGNSLYVHMFSMFQCMLPLSAQGGLFANRRSVDETASALK